MNMPQRKIINYIAQNETIKSFEGELQVWLTGQAKAHGLTWLLVHADDGVIWGRYDDQKNALTLSSDAFPDISPTLRESTLQNARLFSPQGELLVWRTPDGFTYRLILDGDESLTQEEAFEETHLLWGAAATTQSGFTLMQAGANKLCHALPLELPKGAHASLKVRHYISYDPLGQAAITFSRLVNLETRNRGES